MAPSTPGYRATAEVLATPVPKFLFAPDRFRTMPLFSDVINGRGRNFITTKIVSPEQKEGRIAQNGLATQNSDS
jgi:hypothetical protein